MRITGDRQLKTAPATPAIPATSEAPVASKNRHRPRGKKVQPGQRRKSSAAGSADTSRTRGARRRQGVKKLLDAVAPRPATAAAASASHRPGPSGQPGRTEHAGIRKLQARLVREHPVLRAEAKQLIEARLQQRGLRLDADKTYFHTFNGGHSSHVTYNGWEHEGAPASSMSLTDLQMRNFAARLGEDPAELDALTGVYTEGASARSFGVHNEVRLLSSELKQAVRRDDLYTYYHARLQAYWDKNLNAVGRIYRKLARFGLRHAGLSREGAQMLRAVLKQARTGVAHGDVKAHVFDIDSYPSKDMSWLESNGRVLLLMPGNRRPVREYAHIDAMRADIEQMLRTPLGRKELSLHFSLYYRDDGVTYQGVEKWLENIAKGGYRGRIAYVPVAVAGNVFLDQATRTRDAELDDVKRLIKSNGEVDEEECTQFIHVLGFMFPWLFVPAKVAEAGLNLHQAVTDGAASDRRAAAGRMLVNFGELALAILPGLPLKRAPGAAARGVNARSVWFKPPVRTADGRIGYVLGPAQAPLPRDLIQEAFDEAAANGTLNEIDLDGGTPDFTPSGSPQSTRSTASVASSASGSSSGSVSVPRFPSSPSRSPTPVHHASGSWQPGQEVVYGGAASASPAAAAARQMRFNELGWLEHLDLPTVYRAEPIGNLAVNSPEVHGFVGDLLLEGNGQVARDRYLLTMLTEEAARNYGNQTYGEGNFFLYRIDTLGHPAISFRSSVNYDMWSAGVLDDAAGPTTGRAASPPTLPAAPGSPRPATSATGNQPAPAPAPAPGASSSSHVPLPADPATLSSTPSLPAGTEIPEGFAPLDPQEQAGYDRGDVFLDVRDLPPARIHRIS